MPQGQAPTLRARDSRWTAIAWTLLLLLAVSGYFSAYALTVDRVFVSPGDPWITENQPIYRWGGTIGEKLFRPAFLVDRRIRPDYWLEVDQPMSVNVGITTRAYFERAARSGPQSQNDLDQSSTASW